MGDLKAHVLLHPIRMRVVLALGAEELTTKQIHSRLPDVAQATLYRAVTRLVDAGMISVVDNRKRGGAIERVYRVVEPPQSAGAHTSPSELVAAADALAGALSVDAARWAGEREPSPEVALRRDVVRLSPDAARQLARDMAALVRHAAEQSDGNEAYAVTYAVIPGVERDAAAS